MDHDEAGSPWAIDGDNRDLHRAMDGDERGLLCVMTDDEGYSHYKKKNSLHVRAKIWIRISLFKHSDERDRVPWEPEYRRRIWSNFPQRALLL